MAAMKSIVLLLLTAVTLLPQEISHYTGPRVIQKADPEYTPEALEARLVGAVTLSVVIDAEGNPTEIKMIKGLGKGLDEKAVECLQKWRFKPGTRFGEPVSTKATVEIEFRLPPRLPAL
jgi:periplasmic protein TonB